MKKTVALTFFIALIFIAGTIYADSFPDVSADNAYYDTISYLHNRNIITGYMDGQFLPENPITRAEFAAIICRASGLEYSTGNVASDFIDVKIQDWYYSYISPLSTMWIIDDNEDNTFRPNDNIQMTDAIKIIALTSGKDAETICGNLDIRAEGFATRAEIAQLVYNAFEKESADNISNVLNTICKSPRLRGTKESKAARDFLSAKLTDYGYNIEIQEFGYVKVDRDNLDAKIAFDVDSKPQEGIAANIIAIKKAAVETDKTVMLTAHYDTTSTVIGAIDNGSGVATVMELARQLKDMELKYNLELVLFDAEENFMCGSKYFAEKLSEQKKDNIIFAINIDCVGEKNEYMPEVYALHGVDDEKFYNGTLFELQPETAGQYEQSKGLALSFLPVLNRFNMKISDSFTPSSDDYVLNCAGIPAVLIYQRDNYRKVDEVLAAERLDNIDIWKIVYTVDVLKGMILYAETTE